MARKLHFCIESEGEASCYPALMKGDAMKKSDKISQFPKKKRDVLDDLIESGETDEMGLLDLIFLEEMINQGEGEAG